MRALVLALLLALTALPACDRVQDGARDASDALTDATALLDELAEADGAGGMLDLARGLLEKGDVAGCCSVLRMYLETHGDDPMVRAALAVLEAQLGG